MNNDPEWNDSWYFNFHDADKGLTAFMRIGNKPNKNEKTMFFYLIQGDLVLGMRAQEPYAKGKERECGGLSFRSEGGGRFSIRYEGPMADPRDTSKVSIVRMDVDWCACNPEMDYRECVTAEGAAMSSKVASEHFEQFGEATGEIAIDGGSVPVKATGERDRSEGVRDWASPKCWYWLNSVYDRSNAYNVTKLDTGAGAVDAGYFCCGGKNDPLVRCDIEGDGPAPSKYRIHAEGRSGRTYDIEGEVIGKAVLPMAGGAMMLVETISRTSWNGKTGYGIAEFLVKNGA